MSDKRFTFKFWVIYIEAVNWTSEDNFVIKELCKIMWTIARIFLLLIFVWELFVPFLLDVLRM